jgi:Tfp pilus assembly protein PilE
MARTITIALIVALLASIAYISYSLYKTRYEKSTDVALEQEQELHQQRIEELEEQAYSLEEELKKQEDKFIPKEKLTEVFGEQAPAVSVAGKVEKPSCEEIKRNMNAFFNHLDKQTYFKSCDIKENSSGLFKHILTQLLETTPRVTGEMRELPALISNMAFFYRTLGKKRVDCIRNILNNELDITESVFTTFYQWATSCGRCDVMPEECPSLETLYEYAVFFLNTLSGRSYLMRRNSLQRLLTTYYSILILDQANDETLNKYGIDIRPKIELLISEINSTRTLTYRKLYLEKLNTLETKYN